MFAVIKILVQTHCGLLALLQLRGENSNSNLLICGKKDNLSRKCLGFYSFEYTKQERVNIIFVRIVCIYSRI